MPTDDQRQHATELLKHFKGDRFAFGIGCMDRLEPLAKRLADGSDLAVITGGVDKPWGRDLRQAVNRALASAGVERTGPFIPGSDPNSPRDDVFRLADELDAQNPAGVLCLGGGSTLDAAKAALAFRTLRDRYDDLETYFGVGNVTRMLREAGRALPPMLALQTAAGSAAHLTKYSNITDLATNQKLLLIDDVLTPSLALFDYAVTTSMSPGFTMDGALDGLAHCLEVWMGIPETRAETARETCLLGIELIVRHLQAAVDDGNDLDAREGVGLGTDLGGYAIMIGGTNGAHLTSFSMVDLLPHGRACAVMEPYYVVFFAPAITGRLRPVADLLRQAGLTDADPNDLQGRDLGLAVASALQTLCRRIGFPTSLADVSGFDAETHIPRCLQAAKNPALASKLKNMPIPLTPRDVEEYMGSVLLAAATGDLGRIRNLP